MDVTFGSLWSDHHGGIFFPGAAYIPAEGEPNRLNAVFDIGDVVLVWARPQPELNGCHWIATRVQKLEEPTAEEARAAEEGPSTSSDASFVTATSRPSAPMQFTLVMLLCSGSWVKERVALGVGARAR